MKRFAITLLLLPLLLAGCFATLDKNADPVVVNAERAMEIARVTLDAFVRFEYRQRAKCPPEVQDAAERIRQHAPEWFNRAMRLKLAYKQNRDAQNRANLLTAIAVLQTAASEAAQALATYDK